MKNTYKTILTCALAIVVVTAAVLLFARCSDAPKEEVVNIAGTSKSSDSTASNNPGNTGNSDSKTNNGDQNSTNGDSKNTSTLPKNLDEAVPESTILPMETSQLKTAMKLIPQSSFDEDPKAGMGIILYANMRDCFKRMKYDFKKDLESIAKMSPPFMYTAFSSPLNDFEKPQNWIWSVSNILTTTFWVAGDFNINMNLIPMLKKDRYKQFPLVNSSLYTYYLAPEDAVNLRYTGFVAPIANSFAIFSAMDSSDIARKTAVNASENGIGMLGNPDYLKILSYLGEPEACSLTRNSQSSSRFYDIIDHPERLDKKANLPSKEYKDAFEAARNKLRPQSLKYIAAGFYPKDEYALRILLYYDRAETASRDMPVCKSLWNDPKVAVTDNWRKMVKLSATRFSVKDNIGIIECKIDNSMPGIDVINKFSMVLGPGIITTLMKQ